MDTWFAAALDIADVDVPPIKMEVMLEPIVRACHLIGDGEAMALLARVSRYLSSVSFAPNWFSRDSASAL